VVGAGLGGLMVNGLFGRTIPAPKTTSLSSDFDLFEKHIGSLTVGQGQQNYSFS
jgi:hypothetical protein